MFNYSWIICSFKINFLIVFNYIKFNFKIIKQYIGKEYIIVGIKLFLYIVMIYSRYMCYLFMREIRL